MILILDNIRSTHNVGSLLRSADAFGFNTVYFCGITPYPIRLNDARLPHVAKRADTLIAKTALGAEKNINAKVFDGTLHAIKDCKKQGLKIIALEQNVKSQNLVSISVSADLALVVGSEVDGIAKNLLDIVNLIVEIPMLGSKESLNVSVAGGVAMYQLSQ